MNLTKNFNTFWKQKNAHSFFGMIGGTPTPLRFVPIFFLLGFFWFADPLLFRFGDFENDRFGHTLIFRSFPIYLEPRV